MRLTPRGRFWRDVAFWLFVACVWGHIVWQSLTHSYSFAAIGEPHWHGVWVPCVALATFAIAIWVLTERVRDGVR